MDDDTSDTITFLRTFSDYDYNNITTAQIGETWLNYIIEHRTILWWGGLGHSTEHTAYLRLKSGVMAPQSGSSALNGVTVSEQIGAQIFIDGWAMVAPGDPELAAALAGRAASVSHDGEAVYAAQALAAMEAQAFVEPDIDRLIDTGMTMIPESSRIFQMIADVRQWHGQEPDWRKTRQAIDERYGYHRYGGNCHIVPNHALIMLSLLYGDGDFHKSLKIVNTSGWDTDCNSGNLGCLLGIRQGPDAFSNGPDWRGPVADRLYLPTADGGRAITDALTEALEVVNIGRALHRLPPLKPKSGAKFHFELPGSVQGFGIEQPQSEVYLENVQGHSDEGQRSLALHFGAVASQDMVRIATPTFIPSVTAADYFDSTSYPLLASPTLYPGQQLRARVSLDPKSAGSTTNLYIKTYDANDHLVYHDGPRARLEPGLAQTLEWTLPDFQGMPIAYVGVALTRTQAGQGTLYLDYLTWNGVPRTRLVPARGGGRMLRRAWVHSLDCFEDHGPEGFGLIQNRGRGLVIQGTREWDDYTVSSVITLHRVKAAGVAARVQGLRRYYALLLCHDGKVRLFKVQGETTVLAAVDFPWNYGQTHQLTLSVSGSTIEGLVNNTLRLEVNDVLNPLESGAIALVCEEGHVTTRSVEVTPL
jgi:hypothetical protein